MSKNLYKAICVITIILVVAVRLHWAGIPFERDEGEYAYAGQMIGQGVPPYLEVYNMKFPGAYYMYGLSFKLFGETESAPRYLIILLQLIASVFVFLLAKRVVHPLAGWLSVAVFMLYNLSAALKGASANAEHFLVAFLAPAIYFLYQGVDKKNTRDLILAGAWLAMACLMKQHAAIFVLAAALWIVYELKQSSLKYLFAFAVGGALPLLAMGFYLWHAGVLGRFYFLTFQYAQQYVSLNRLTSGAYNLLGFLKTGNLIAPVWFCLTPVSIVAFLFLRQRPKAWVFVLILLLASGMAVIPGFYFRRHYFLIMTPALSLLFTYTAFKISDYIKFLPANIFVTLVAAVSTLSFFYEQQGFLASTHPFATLLHKDPYEFAEFERYSSFVKSHSVEGERICQVGQEPELFFQSQRKSASGYIYLYPLFEKQKYASVMTDEFIAQVNSHKPAILVYSSADCDGGLLQNAKLLNWFTEFKTHYKLVAQYIPLWIDTKRSIEFDTIAPIDTFALTVPQISIYKRITDETK